MTSSHDATPMPRVLLVEDDPASLAFLTAAVQAIPAEVDTAGNVADALALALGRPHDLWLFDAQLPDGSGRELLETLRRERCDVPALAHTASDDPRTLDALRAAGFDEVLVKPLPAVSVQVAVRDRLGLADTSSGIEPVWDDEAAASALNGNRAHIETLRRLFTTELPHACERIATSAAAGNIEGVRAELHKLRASCGFVGAARLGDAVDLLHDRPEDPGLLAALESAAEETGESWASRQSSAV